MTICRSIWLTFASLLVASAVYAQEDCPAIVQAALDSTRQVCEATGRNQACYGNINLQATPQEGVDEFTFEAPGDLADIAGIQTLTLSSMDTSSGEWGVSVMHVQANLPDDAIDDVTLLLFGDVEVTNKTESQPAPVLLNITASGSANVRGGASTNDAIVASLTSGQTVITDGRNEMGDWLQIQLDGGAVGWVFADLVTVEGDAMTLPVVDAANTEPVSAAPTVQPMSAFYFKSGMDDAPCEEAPDSGILIQTPEGVGKISLLINEVDIQLGSTVYIQAQPDGEVTISVIEGSARITAFDTTVIAPAGTRARVPLDANGAASGEPIGPEAYIDSNLAALPISILPRGVTVAPSLTQAEMDDLLTGLPIPGSWLWTSDVSQYTGTCSDGSERTFNSVKSATLDIGIQGNQVVYVGRLLAPIGAGVYQSETSEGMTNSTGQVVGSAVTQTTLTVISPNSIEGEETSTWTYTATADAGLVCVFTRTYHMELQSSSP